MKQQLNNLFDKFVEPNDGSFRISTYRLCKIPTRVNWDFATKVIDASKITFVQFKDITNQIQDDGGDDVLMVDFANKYIGGGVLTAGLVQEELLF